MAKHRNGHKVVWRELDRMVARMAQTVHPKKIMLFGSYAYGRPSRHSDVDLLVIMPSRRRPATRAAVVSRALGHRPFPVDIMVRTPQEIRQRLVIGDQFIREVLTKGLTLYEG